MPDSTRRAFERITRDARPWRSPPNSPHERFAEAYRLCSLYAPGVDFYARGDGGGYGYAPTPSQHRRVCALIAATGASLGWTRGPGAAQARRRLLSTPAQ